MSKGPSASPPEAFLTEVPFDNQDDGGFQDNVVQRPAPQRQSSQEHANPQFSTEQTSPVPSRSILFQNNSYVQCELPFDTDSENEVEGNGKLYTFEEFLDITKGPTTDNSTSSANTSVLLNRDHGQLHSELSSTSTTSASVGSQSLPRSRNQQKGNGQPTAAPPLPAVAAPTAVLSATGCGFTVQPQPQTFSSLSQSDLDFRNHQPLNPTQETLGINMGLMQLLCCVGQQSRANHYRMADTTPASGAPTPRQEYSWDTNRVDLQDFVVANKNNEVVVKKSGDICGQQYVIENCNDTMVIVLDHSATITVDDCEDCTFVFGPCKGSIFLRNCKNCTLFSASQQFRARDSVFVSHIFCSTRPVIEESKGEFYPLKMNYDHLEQHMVEAGLNPFCNEWHNIYDFTPERNSKHYIVDNEAPDTDLIDKLELIASAYQLSFVQDNSYFTTPNRLRKSSKNGESVLLLVRFPLGQTNLRGVFSQVQKLIKDVALSNAILKDYTSFNVQKGDLKNILPNWKRENIVGDLIVLEFTGPNCKDIISSRIANAEKKEDELCQFDILPSDCKTALYRFAELKHSV